MKSKKDLNITYMGHLQNVWYANELADPHEISSLVDKLRKFGGIIHHSFPLLFVIDYTAQQYLVMTDACYAMSGYHPKEFIESRLDKLLDVYQKDDFKILNQEIFPRNTELLKNVPHQDHDQYLFSNSFRFVRSDKKLAHVLQRGTYITSEKTNLPLYNIGILIDIADFKADNVITHTIEKMSLEGGHVCKDLIEINHFYPYEEDKIISEREKIILTMMAEGLSSKMIAGKLKISENTISNHRQNIMRKTNTKNVAQLVAFAIQSKII